MSWAITIPMQEYGTFRGAIRAAKIEGSYNATPEVLAQWEEQLKAAKIAAEAILENAEFGFSEKELYGAYMGGHANHDGADGSYTSHEFVTVTINRNPAP